MCVAQVTNKDPKTQRKLKSAAGVKGTIGCAGCDLGTARAMPDNQAARALEIPRRRAVNASTHHHSIAMLESKAHIPHRLQPRNLVRESRPICFLFNVIIFSVVMFLFLCVVSWDGRSRPFSREAWIPIDGCITYASAKFETGVMPGMDHMTRP